MLTIVECGVPSIVTCWLFIIKTGQTEAEGGRIHQSAFDLSEKCHNLHIGACQYSKFPEYSSNNLQLASIVLLQSVYKIKKRDRGTLELTYTINTSDSFLFFILTRLFMQFAILLCFTIHCEIKQVITKHRTIKHVITLSIFHQFSDT